MTTGDTTEDTTETVPVVDQAAVARELALLGVLADRVKAEQEARRRVVESWTPGTRQIVALPNEDEPTRPVKVAEIRADGGQTFAKVGDRAAWHAWVKANAPTEYGMTSGGRTGWALDNASTEALVDAHAAVQAACRDDDPWVSPDPVKIARAMLDVLEQAGYTLTRVQTVDPEPFVRPVYEDETLRMSQKAGTPVAPGGLIPEGVTVDNHPTKAYVKIEKDEGLRTSWVWTQTGAQLALTSALLNAGKGDA